MKFKDILGKFSLRAEAARTFEEDPLQAYRYHVSLPTLPAGLGFQKVSGISREMEVVEYFENMYDHAHKLPGRESVGDVTFEKGCFKDATLATAYTDVFSKNTRTTATVQILDRFGKVARTFEFGEAWFSKYELGDLDSTSSDVLIETLTMVFEYFL